MMVGNRLASPPQAVDVRRMIGVIEVIEAVHDKLNAMVLNVLEGTRTEDGDLQTLCVKEAAMTSPIEQEVAKIAPTVKDAIKLMPKSLPARGHLSKLPHVGGQPHEPFLSDGSQVPESSLNEGQLSLPAGGCPLKSPPAGGRFFPPTGSQVSKLPHAGGLLLESPQVGGMPAEPSHVGGMLPESPPVGGLIPEPPRARGLSPESPRVGDQSHKPPPVGSQSSLPV